MANENFALDLDLFDVEKNAYVPTIEPKKSKLKKLELLMPKPVTKTEFETETRNSRRIITRVCAFALVALMFFGPLIYCRIVHTERQYDLVQAQKDLKVAENYEIELRTKLNAMISKESIKDYAENKLGMVKRENYQINYFDISEEGGVILIP